MMVPVAQVAVGALWQIWKVPVWVPVVVTVLFQTVPLVPAT